MVKKGLRWRSIELERRSIELEKRERWRGGERERERES
jgi:hypothetical protein